MSNRPMKYRVCDHCNGDILGQCEEQDAEKGFDVFCFDCDAPVTTRLEAMPSEVTE